MKHLKIDTLLFQGQIVTTDFYAHGGVNQILIELRNQKMFDNVLKVDWIKEDETTESIYIHEHLTKLIADARAEYAKEDEVTTDE